MFSSFQVHEQLWDSWAITYHTGFLKSEKMFKCLISNCNWTFSANPAKKIQIVLKSFDIKCIYFFCRALFWMAEFSNWALPTNHFFFIILLYDKPILNSKSVFIKLTLMWPRGEPLRKFSMSLKSFPQKLFRPILDFV